MIASPIAALIVTLALALAWLRLVDFAAGRGWLDPRLSRKVIHIGTGPLFVLCWLLFPDRPEARWLAALVPGLITAQFLLVGLGLWKDPQAVQAMSRTGDRREILRGPLFYGIVFVVLTVLFWTDRPAGMIALMLLCGGDGLADVVGRRLRGPALPWNRGKTISGSLAMLVGGWVIAWLVLAVFQAAGVFSGPPLSSLAPLLVISLVGTAVETLPLRDLDNLTVPLAAVLAALALGM